jgi:hypothetical protein
VAALVNKVTNESKLTPSRSILEKLYNRLSHEADSPIGFAKRGLPVLLRARNTRIQIKRRIDFFCAFCSCAVGVRGDTPKCRKNLIGAFNGTDAAVLDATAAAVPAIAVSGDRAPPNDAENAAALLAKFEQNAEKTHYPLCSSAVGGRGDQNLLGFNGTESPTLRSSMRQPLQSPRSQNSAR